MYKQTDRWLRDRTGALLYIVTAVLAVSLPLINENRDSGLVDALGGPEEPLVIATTTTTVGSTTSRATNSTTATTPSTVTPTAVPTAIEPIIEVAAPALSSPTTVSSSTTSPTTKTPTTRRTTPSTTPPTTQPPTTRPPTTQPTTTQPTTTQPTTTKPPTTQPTTTKPTTTKPPTTQPPTTQPPENCSSGPWKTLAKARRGFSKDCKGYPRVDCAELRPKQWTCSSEQLERPTTTQPTTTTTQPTTTTTTTQPTTTATQPTTQPPITAETTTSTTSPQPAVLGLSVLNAANGAPFDGGTILFFTVEAFAPSGTNSVRFSMSGPFNANTLENSARWTLFGNSGNRLSGRPAIPGTYTVTSQAYSGNSGGGDVLATGSVTFSFG